MKENGVNTGRVELEKSKFVKYDPVELFVTLSTESEADNDTAQRLKRVHDVLFSDITEYIADTDQLHNEPANPSEQ